MRRFLNRIGYAPKNYDPKSDIITVQAKLSPDYDRITKVNIYGGNQVELSEPEEFSEEMKNRIIGVLPYEPVSHKLRPGTINVSKDKIQSLINQGFFPQNYKPRPSEPTLAERIRDIAANELKEQYDMNVATTTQKHRRTYNADNYDTSDPTQSQEGQPVQQFSFA